MAANRQKYPTLTGTGAQAGIALPGPCSQFGVQLKGNGAAPTSWTLTLEGSLDGANWSTLITHNANDGSTQWTTGKPCLFVRANLSALSLGSATSVDVNFVATT
jgi:hypothetical protein